jgi:hypothetical protein
MEAFDSEKVLKLNQNLEVFQGKVSSAIITELSMNVEYSIGPEFTLSMYVGYTHYPTPGPRAPPPPLYQHTPFTLS